MACSRFLIGPQCPPKTAPGYPKWPSKIWKEQITSRLHLLQDLSIKMISALPQETRPEFQVRCNFHHRVRFYEAVLMLTAGGAYISIQVGVMGSPLPCWRKSFRSRLKSSQKTSFGSHSELARKSFKTRLELVIQNSFGSHSEHIRKSFRTSIYIYIYYIYRSTWDSSVNLG